MRTNNKKTRKKNWLAHKCVDEAWLAHKCVDEARWKQIVNVR